MNNLKIIKKYFDDWEMNGELKCNVWDLFNRIYIGLFICMLGGMKLRALKKFTT